ncbi:uncharacterized protein N7496_003981 [Penicillium cataractarum]|uniref:TM7S3/TM198-like domain-containing protein n=1 Tax=Penicillium cataractarum TaxID=2100454 RepID=A0A9W9SSB0_9EURO|nr:uncharacterized protein N7496_003981 [Penicillium cataractarum]KAJ5381553.1 hypothetical protein N7496_003981 [Penicillium cataractarum]
MRWSLFSTWILVLLFGVALSAPARDIAQRNDDAFTTVEKRAEPDATTTGADNSPSQTSTVTTTNTDSAAATAATATAVTTTSNNTTSSKTSHSTYVATTIPSLDGSTDSSSDSEDGTKQKYTGGLPLQPQITPAWGVGGIILLLLGAALAFIGIRKQWVHIFLSTGFLAALGVTVLIVYVMNPPVSNAIQGGYLVAAFFTGAIFGGLALVFREITEGLGCLLGGFCTGMWFLTVKSGGLLTGSAAKTGFIIAFTVGFWCLSFSHYTRSYGLILGTSISGATALVLGIDCYSRAGLKEFWLYIWGLNNSMFPLGTNTYPVTRNIRVELAITVIITIFGVIAQMRLWKVIKERRAKEEASRKEAEKKNEEAEAEVGRQLEEKNLRERTEWENMYGNGAAGKEASMTETAVADDSRRGSDGFESTTHDPEKETSIEMKDMSAPENSAGASESGRNLDAVEEVEAETVGEHQDGHTSQADDQQKHIETEDVGLSTARPVTMWPEPILREDTGSEHGAVVGSEPGSPRSKRFSGKSLMNRLSWRSVNSPLSPKLNGKSESEEALVVQDDASSSILGVVDDACSVCPSVVSDCHDAMDEKIHEEIVSDKLPVKNVLAEVTESGLNSQAPRGAPTEANGQVGSSLPHHVGDKENINEPARSGNGFQIHRDNDTEEQVHTDATHDQDASQPKQAECIALQVQPNSQEAPYVQEVTPEATRENGHEEEQVQESQLPDVNQVANKVDEDKEENAKEETREPANQVEREPDSVSQTKPLKKSVSAKLDASTVKEIPEQTSMVVNSFRTNEWAKHLANAEFPELEPIQQDCDYPENPTETEEVAAPVNVAGLLQTPLNGLPPPVINSPEQMPTSPEHHRRRSNGSNVPPAGVSKFNMSDNMYSMSGAISPPISRNISSASLLPRQEKEQKPVPIRSVSTPFLTITTPNQEEETSDSPKWSGPPPLLAVREDMVRNRMSSTSLRYDPYASRSQSRLSLADPTIIASPPLVIPEERDEYVGTDTAEDADDIPLSKRRAMLQRQTIQSPSVSSLQSIESPRSPPQSPPNSGRSAAVMAAWRQSVREDITQRRDPLSHPPSPGTPANSERPRASWGSVQKLRESSAAKVENTIADRMQRGGSMTDLHRQAMRRMQASANRKL